MPGMPMSSRTTSGRNAGASSRAAIPSAAIRTSLPMIRKQQRQAGGGVLIVVDDEDAAARGIDRPRYPGAAVPSIHARVVRGQRQADDELAPLALAVAPRQGGPAVHLDQLAHQRQPDAQPALRPVCDCGRPG